MYEWRKLTPEIRAKIMVNRRIKRLPMHSPPHEDRGVRNYHISAACYEHESYIGHSPERMDTFETELLAVFEKRSDHLYAWCVLPNHYHALIRAENVKATLYELGELHGRTSFSWNGEENTRGRKVWYNAVDRAIRSDRHFWATMNYVLHQPVHHQYTRKWQEWPYSSAEEYLKRVGEKRALEIWREYKIDDYGKGWDDAEM
ncbi:hypothetical protein LLG95_16190 [bacterium]|nr:hypothetical protein [bacterium]